MFVRSACVRVRVILKFEDVLCGLENHLIQIESPNADSSASNDRALAVSKTTQKRRFRFASSSSGNGCSFRLSCMPTTIANKCARNFMSLRSLFWTYLISFSVCTFQPVHTCEFPYALSAWSSVSLQSFLKSLFPRLLARASWAKLPWGHFFARVQSPIPVLLDNVLAGIPHGV